ncbi:MAG: hypothetical protein HYX68_05395 [Planctomycetes bacterium]|nr:hypothetical protein [Planctomycetota bacterium]
MRRLACIIMFATFSPSASAVEPTLRTLDLRGLQIGGTTTLTIDGDDLGKAPRLLLPFPAKQTLKAGNTDKKAVFEVTLPEDVTPGYHHLRIVADGGVSLPVVVGVDKLPQAGPTPLVKALPIALHGNVAGANIVETKFQGKAKQRVMIEVEAQRIGAKIRPILHLYSPKKLQLAWSWGKQAHFGDARLEAILPEDGIYTVTLHDAEYAAPAPGFFRLKIGDWDYVGRVFPPVIGRNQPWTVSLLRGAAAFQMMANAPKDADWLVLPWPSKPGSVWSGPRPFVAVSRHLEFVEQAAKSALQDLPSGEIAVTGKLLTPDEEDRYRVTVHPGAKIRLEVFAERLGSPIDVALVVRNEKGVQLARGDDSPGTLDPVLEYTVPANVKSIVIGVIDAQGRGGPNGLYRLHIDPRTPASNRDGFRLITPAQRIALPAGGRDVVPVLVDRQGYGGKIDISPALPLPAGVTLSGTTIPDGADGTLITLEHTGPAFNPVVTSWRGRSANGIEQTIHAKDHPLMRLQPWLATEIALAPSSDKASDFAIEWRDLKPDAVMEPAKKLALPITLKRKAGKETVRLTLLTSQLAPRVNNQPDPNKTLRQEKAIELAATMKSGDLVVLVPADLPAPSYDVTVQAELLGAGKKPLAVAYASVRRMVVDLPIVIKLDGPSRLETTLGAKKAATLKIQGKLERKRGLKTDVALSLTGLPAGAKAETVTLKGDAAAFVINVTFPATFAPAEFKGVKLSASYAPNPKQANVRVRSREVALTLVLTAAKN